MMNNKSRHSCFTKPKIICVLRHFYDFEMPAADSFFYTVCSAKFKPKDSKRSLHGNINICWHLFSFIFNSRVANLFLEDKCFICSCRAPICLKFSANEIQFLKMWLDFFVRRNGNLV